MVIKANGRGYPVKAVIVLELAQCGELFNFVDNSGFFEEKYARYFFQYIIEGLEYCHKSGFAHRNINPQTILLDKDFNVKIADFGFNGPIRGRDGSYLLTKKLGTASYMAPELLRGDRYSGEAVDLFAAAIVLFICVAGHPPFTCALDTDCHYELIVNKRWNFFWKLHVNRKPGGDSFFSDGFKSLMESMFQRESTLRLNMD